MATFSLRESQSAARRVGLCTDLLGLTLRFERSTAKERVALAREIRAKLREVLRRWPKGPHLAKGSPEHRAKLAAGRRAASYARAKKFVAWRIGSSGGSAQWVRDPLGLEMSLLEVARKYGVKANTLYVRLRRNRAGLAVRDKLERVVFLPSHVVDAQQGAELCRLTRSPGPYQKPDECWSR